MISFGAGERPQVPKADFSHRLRRIQYIVMRSEPPQDNCLAFFAPRVSG